MYRQQDRKPGQKPRKQIKKRQRARTPHLVQLLDAHFDKPFCKLEAEGVDIKGLKLAYTQDSRCRQCRVGYLRDEYCDQCHLLTRHIVTVCGSYACRMRRVGVNGSLHPSLMNLGMHTEDEVVDPKEDTFLRQDWLENRDDDVTALPSLPNYFEPNCLEHIEDF